MNIAHIEPESFIYGPGCRTVIWTQGCSIRCPGCWNTDLWSFEPQQELSVDTLVSDITNRQSGIEGVTVLGGEPFDQYTELYALCKRIAESGLSLIVYTGYEKPVLQRKHYDALFPFLDILISGPYIEKQRSMDLGLTGSHNQQYDFFTGRYSQTDLPNSNEIEISFTETGSMRIYGYPDWN